MERCGGHEGPVLQEETEPDERRTVSWDGQVCDHSQGLLDDLNTDSLCPPCDSAHLE